MLISTFIFPFFLFLTYTLFLLGMRKSDARDERLEQRVAEALRESESVYTGEVHITRADSIGGNPAINRLLSKLDFVKRLDRTIKQADAHTTVSRLLATSGVAGLMAMVAASTVVNSMSAFVFALVAAAAPILHVARKRQKRLQAFNAQLPDTLDLLSRSLAVGHAFSESLHQVAAEMPDPIAAEFRLTFEEQKLGL